MPSSLLLGWRSLMKHSIFQLHLGEIVCTNAAHQALVHPCGIGRHENETFRRLLDDRFRSELDGAIREEREQHGAAMTSHHVVSALTFGFWKHHRAILDRKPARKHQGALDLIRWVCADTAAWVASSSRVPTASTLRPKPK
jgi:hypothetical protein